MNTYLLHSMCMFAVISSATNLIKASSENGPTASEDHAGFINYENQQRLVPFPHPIGDLTKQQLEALKKKVKKDGLKVALYLPIKKLKDLKKKVIKIKGVKLAAEFLVLLKILLEAFDTLKDKFEDAAIAASAATAATTVTDVAFSSGDTLPGTGSTIPLANPTIPSGASLTGALTMFGILTIVLGIVMAQLYLIRENNQRVSVFSHRWSNDIHDNPVIRCKNYQVTNSSAGKIVPYQALRDDYNDCQYYHYDY